MGDSLVAKTKKTNLSKESIEVRKPAAARNAKAIALKEQADVVVMDRRGSSRRKLPGRRIENAPVPVERRTLERRAKVSRRRQIDPTTCERDYSEEEVQFMSALDQYKRVSGRMFPTCSEILEVLRGLGYEKRPQTPELPPDTSLAVVESVPAPTILMDLPTIEPTSIF